jgi:hypothetical protein
METRSKKMLEKTEGATKNDQSRETTWRPGKKKMLEKTEGTTKPLLSALISQ